MLRVEQVERQALADRQAEMSVAIAERWEDYEPVSVAARVDAWAEWLASNPNDSEEARTEARIRELMGGA